MKHRSRSVETFGDMERAIVQERSSAEQKNLSAVKEKIVLPRTENSLLFQGKHRARHSFSHPYLDPKSESSQNGSAEKVARSKSSENDRKPQPGRRASDDNELVKHMSNLPGFLLKKENENTIQDKALNFGVLDWKRLEKWKYTERMPGKLPKRPSPRGNPLSSASGLPKMVPNLRKQLPSHNRNPSWSYSAKQPAPHGSNFSLPQRQPPAPHSLHLNLRKEKRNGGHRMEEEYAECIKFKGKGTHDQEYQAAESFRICGQQNHFQQRGELCIQNCSETNVFNSKSIDPNKELMSGEKASSSSTKQGKPNSALLSPNKIIAQGKKSEMRFDKVKLASESCSAYPEDVLQVPTHFHEKRCSDSSQSMELRTSLDTQLSVAAQNRLSEFFSPCERYSGEFSDDIPHSCPLPSSVVESPNLFTSQATEVDTCTRAKPVQSISLEAKCSTMNEETARASILTEAFNRRRAEVAEPDVKGRSPSPARRYSFNLGRMNRSFSFKESSAQQLSATYTSVKSGPMKPEIAPDMGNIERDQANANSRGGLSPLRRLLDPLFKPKTTAETVRPPNGSLLPRSIGAMSTKGNTGAKGPSQDRRHEASTFQALLQLAFKNGLPFFKLVFENSKDMLAAAVKRLPSNGSSDPCLIYSIYSVHEIRKKSMNWINHGSSKSKSSSLGYNIIGQMKISNSHLKVNTGGTIERDARECVLYGVDSGQVDKQILEYLPIKEIAAIVIKNSSEKVNDVQFRAKNCPGRESQQNSQGIVVILPGGVHGVPIKGVPSSLISRWRSSGSCDCGGWDVGCKLRTLAECGRSSNFLQESTYNSIDHVNLYVQGGVPMSKPVFSLKPFSNELYSIELDASMSLLEAFATSVAYVTCSRFPEIIEIDGQTKAEHSADTDKSKTRNAFQDQIPAKFVACPPWSPVGRI